MFFIWPASNSPGLPLRSVLMVDRCGVICYKNYRIAELRKCVSTGEGVSSRLIIGNLSLEISDSELDEVFSKVGTVDAVLIPADAKTGRKKGFAFVDMASRTQAELAVRQLNGMELAGRAVSVHLCEKQRPHVSLFEHCLKFLNASF